MATKKSEKKTPSIARPSLWHWRVVVPIVVAAGLFLIANSALWVNNVLFNTEKFTSVTTTALLSESSRMSIASGVVEQALADRPVAQRLVSQPATKFIAGLLDSSLALRATEKVVSRLQTAVTTKNPQNIELDLTGVKNVASKLIALADVANVEVTPQRELPDTIFLFDASSVPNVYKYGQVVLWLAPLAGLSAIVLFAYPHIKERKLIRRVMVLQGVTLILFGFFALSIGPLFRPQVLGSVESSNARVVVENIYNAFITTFNEQTMWIFTAGIILLVVPSVLWLYSSQVKPRLAKRKSS